jgi:WD40 repeat protein
MFRTRSSSHFALTLVILTIASTPLRAEESKPAEKINFQDHVLPIFRAKCGNCHGAASAKGGLVLESFGASIQGGASGAVIEPGDLDGSRLWALVTHKEQPAMPPKEPKLPEEMLTIIRKWIEGGALENKDSQPKIRKKAQFTLSVASVSGDKPAGPPPMPENLSTEPLVVSSRGNVVTALATSPWAPLAAVAGHKQVVLYNLDDQSVAGVLPFPEGTIHVLRFSRNGALLLAGGGRGGQSGRVVVFDVKTGARVFEVGAEADVVLAADISADHSQIALGGPKKMVRVFSTADGEQLFEMKKHTDWITAVEFSPDSVLLATGDRSNGLVVWEANTGREFYVLNGHGAGITGMSWRVDSNVLASTSEDAAIRLWEMTSGTQIKAWGAHGGGSAAVWFLRDGRLASTGRDRVSKIWDQNGAQVLALAALGDLGMKIAYSETNHLILAGDWSGTIRLFDGKDGADRGTLATNPAPLAARLDAATKAAAAAKAAADQAALQLAAMQKGFGDRKAAAETTAKALAETQGVIPTLQAATTEASKLAAQTGESFRIAETALANVTVVFEKAKQEKEGVEKSDDKRALPVKTAAYQEAEKLVAAVKPARDTFAQAKAAADKLAAESSARFEAATVAAAAAKAAADKALAEATVTPDQTKALEQAAALAKQTAAVAAARKALVEKLTAEKNRPAPMPNAVASQGK